VTASSRRRNRVGVLGALMSQEIVLAGKGPVALIARVRASGGVGHDVRAQVEGTREASCADRADVDVGDLGE
jgi:hypothetical protein